MLIRNNNKYICTRYHYSRRNWVEIILLFKVQITVAPAVAVYSVLLASPPKPRQNRLPVAVRNSQYVVPNHHIFFAVRLSLVRWYPIWKGTFLYISSIFIEFNIFTYQNSKTFTETLNSQDLTSLTRTTYSKWRLSAVSTLSAVVAATSVNNSVIG